MPTQRPPNGSGGGKQGASGRLHNPAQRQTGAADVKPDETERLLVEFFFDLLGGISRPEGTPQPVWTFGASQVTAAVADNGVLRMIARFDTVGYETSEN
jgi:hypothetical protein